MKSSRILAEDYTVLLHIPRNPVFHECTKYINCHEVRMKIVDGFLKTMYFRTCDQLVNALTKALDPSSFQESELKTIFIQEERRSKKMKDQVANLFGLGSASSRKITPSRKNKRNNKPFLKGFESQIRKE
ncbi:hypothetical protein Bca4012_037564 [Brassica carinata]